MNRRDFLKKLGLGAVVVALGGVAAEAQAQPKRAVIQSKRVHRDMHGYSMAEIEWIPIHCGGMDYKLPLYTVAT